MPRRIPLIVLLATLALVPRPASAHNLCFADKTPYCFGDPFSDYWQENGGLSVFGYPITAAADEASLESGQLYLTQWAERNRFEVHPENAGTPYAILLSLLGKDRLRQLGRDPGAQPREVNAKAGCLWFEETGHNVCNQGGNQGFKAYWETHGLAVPGLDKYGRSLQLFGLPLTEPKMETNGAGDTVLTQWFERARFEWHPDEPDQFKVLLGLLGSEIREAPGRDLREGRARWASRGARSYDFELAVMCFCPPDYTDPVRVAVRDGAPVAVTNASTGQPVDADRRSWYERFDTVDELFAIVEDAIARNAARLDAAYDPTLGYPTRIFIDYDLLIADEELSLRVNRLTLVP